MRELVNARDALIKDRVAALNRQAIAVSSFIKRQLAQRLQQIDGQIAAIDRRLKTLRNADFEPVPALRHLDEGTGARPTRLAAWACSRRPSSGVSTTSTFAVINAIRLNPEFKAKYEAMVKGGHVKSLSGSWAPAADGSLSMGLAAVPRLQPPLLRSPSSAKTSYPIGAATRHT